jgi:hypothetical protein
VADAAKDLFAAEFLQIVSGVAGPYPRRPAMTHSCTKTALTGT